MAGVFEKPAAEKLSVQDIVAGVKANADSVMPCLQKARSAGEIPAGTYKLILSWNIRPNGTVDDGKVTDPASLMETSLPGCFARSMRKWTFPATASGAPVRNFPFGPFTVK
jgi:hypothetical protein